MPPTSSDSSWSNPEVAGPMVHTSLVRLVERNSFSRSSASVTASTSMELERAWSACEEEDWSPEEDVPLSVTRTEGSQLGKEAMMESFGKTGEAVMVVVVTGNRRLDFASRSAWSLDLGGTGGEGFGGGCRREEEKGLVRVEEREGPHRFDALDFFERFRGKSIMFVGDSLSRNQWQSLTCMLHSAVPTAKYNVIRVNDVSIFEFMDYEVKVMLDRNVYLVDIVREKIGRVLKLDSIVGGKLWKDIDMLIFNTWHWWNRRGPSQPWDYVEVEGQISKDIDRMLAFQKALVTWAGWVDLNIDPAKSRVFFQGISPSHYNGSEWHEPRARSCVGQKEPLLESIYPGALPPALGVLKNVLSTIKKPVTLLDITNLSLLRKDGHPSIYGLAGRTGMDCSHWCLCGVPDSWNEILYNFIL